MLDYIYIGDHHHNRDKFFQKVNKRVGKGNYFLAFSAGKKLYSWNWGMQLYEDAYLSFLTKDISLVKKLVSMCDVCEINNKDLESYLNFKHQKQDKDHNQDIAIRRCLIRLGVWFKGTDLLSIPGTEFDHSKIPFHLPHLLRKPDSLKSIKSWLDGNRLMVVASSSEDKAQLAEIMVS